ncbi:hemicentin-1-like [Thunnus albacares]|uniref:hemicentin-1-like n=1 Tax=Thunnus albacares TaxID=8236 RepID=UPI001CF60DED|nr:hemicentin-1-like [Thunnus albacares]
MNSQCARLPCSLSSKQNIIPQRLSTDCQKEVFLYDAGIHDNNGLAGQDEQFKGRLSHFPNELKSGDASIIIRNTKVADSGDYICEFPCLQPKRQIFHIKLLVVEPNVINMTVEEGSDVILPCSLSSKENIEFKHFDWKKDDQKEVFRYDAGRHSNNGRSGQDKQFIGRVSHFEDELKSGNASIIIKHTTVADSGDYTCEFPLLQPRQIFYIKLHVGAATKPYVTSLDVTKNSALLQCEVRGASPKPKLRWQDSDGNILQAEEPKETERGGRYDVILNITVTKTDNYRCVATQEEINHQIYAETHVYISEPDVIKVTVEEGSDVILPCSLNSKENIVSKLFDWKKDGQKEVFMYNAGIHTNKGHTGQDKQFIGRVSHFDKELKSGNASIIIKHTTVADSGDYTCEFPQLQPRQIFYIKLVVGECLATKPYVKTLNQTENWALLQCEVRGAFPKPKLHWQDSDGNILHAEEPKETERGDVILNITVTKTDSYRCVATQEEIKHQIYAETYVYIHGGILKNTTAENNSEPDVIRVEERSDVILPCSPSSKESIVFTLFDWKKDGQKEVFRYDSGIKTTSEQFIGRVSHFDDELKSGNASIIIRNTKVADSGNYTCNFTQLQPRQIFHIKLHVVAAARKPYVMIVDQTADSALLQCEVQGASPKPKLHWQDSDGIIPQAEEPKETERGGHYDVILQTTVTKTNNYSCVATQEEINHQIYAEIHVYIHEPDVIRVEEGSDVILPCSPSSKESIEFKLFVWKKDDQKEVFIYDAGIHSNGGHPGQDEQFKGRVSHFEDELKSGDASIIIRNTKVADSGDYTCDFPQLQPRQIFYIKLHVVAAARKPYVTILQQTQYWALLQCEVRGASPKPKLHWQDSDGNILHAEEPKETERGGRYDVILQTTVTKTDNYHCVATQEEIKHQIYAQTYVYIHEPNVIKVIVEGSDIILPCSLSSKENIVYQSFVWTKDGQKQVFFYDAGLHTNNDHPGQDEQFKGRVSHFDDELKSGNASIIIRNTTVADSGDYTCDFPQLQPRQIFYIKLHVVDGVFKDRTAENIPGAAPQPYVTVVDQTADSALLQCEVRDAFPKPKLHWQDSDGNILKAEETKESERGGRYNVILKITVTKIDNYRCVATQEKINHQTYAETYVNISGSLSGWIVAVAVLGVVVFLGVAGCCIKC